jgi:MSHA biogenesis protein MshM
MYERHWQLERAPFDHDRRSDSFYSGRRHEEAIVKLNYLIECGKGAAALVGASGTGKTHVLEMVRQRVSHGCPVVQLVYPQLSPHELVAYLTQELGGSLLDFNSANLGLDLLLRSFESRLRELTEAGHEPVIILDDAHLIEDRRVFQTLHQLMNFQQPGRSNFALILAGQPELVGTLQTNTQIADRMAFHCFLQSLTEAETVEYIIHRLQAAGRSKPIFDPSAMRVLYELSAGIPRRINRLCDFALLIGYANQLQQISADQIEGIHSEITRSNIAA